MFGKFPANETRVIVFRNSHATSVMLGSPAGATAAYLGKFLGRVIDQSRVWPLVFLIVQPTIKLAPATGQQRNPQNFRHKQLRLSVRDATEFRKGKVTPV